MTPEQIQALIDDAQAALDARAELDHAAQAVTAAVQAYAAAAEVTVLQAWRALAPEGVEVPPDPEPEPVPDAPLWVQPQAHKPYRIGDRVSFRGSVYESVHDANVWSPTAYPMGWRKL
ncbi:hypothetical protein [Brachybacterium paraconglomeratum]|uniref:hypothetical protein n=1 Tax=Brachybacterium paraconglomeratum TaxID=173362 RepID=UPI0022AF7855|nr:hypothetical protein [Brachybacterium paraconglomeratum]